MSVEKAAIGHLTDSERQFSEAAKEVNGNERHQFQ